MEQRFRLVAQSYACEKRGLTLGRIQRMSAEQPGPWDEVLTLLMPRAVGQDCSPSLLPDTTSQGMLPALVKLGGGCLCSRYKHRLRPRRGGKKEYSGCLKHDLGDLDYLAGKWMEHHRDSACKEKLKLKTEKKGGVGSG